MDEAKLGLDAPEKQVIEDDKINLDLSDKKENQFPEAE